jgi:hypothetical protein
MPRVCRTGRTAIATRAAGARFSPVVPDFRPRIGHRRAGLSHLGGTIAGMVTVEDVRRIAAALPRTEEALVGDRVKFRVGRLVYLSLSRDETVMGFAFPKEERVALVAAEPDKFLMPSRSDERYNWVQVRLAAIDQAELSELVLDAWRMCVPKTVAANHVRNLEMLGEVAVEPAQRGGLDDDASAPGDVIRAARRDR